MLLNLLDSQMPIIFCDFLNKIVSLKLDFILFLVILSIRVVGTGDTPYGYVPGEQPALAAFGLLTVHISPSPPTILSILIATTETNLPSVTNF